MALRPLLELSNDDLESLEPGAAITENVIDAFLRVIERRSLQEEDLPSVFAFDVYFKEEFLGGGYRKVKYRFEDVNLFEKKILFFPFHVPIVGSVGHWSLVCVYPGAKSICSLDSEGLDLSLPMDIVRYFMITHAKDVGIQYHALDWSIRSTPHKSLVPRQSDYKSCGVFLCYYADTVAQYGHFKQNFSPLTGRKIIKKAIILGKIGRDDFADLPWQLPGPSHAGPSQQLPGPSHPGPSQQPPGPSHPGPSQHESTPGPTALVEVSPVSRFRATIDAPSGLPARLVQYLRSGPPRLTPRQRTNQRVKVFRRDGTFFRIHTRKLYTLRFS